MKGTDDRRSRTEGPNGNMLLDALSIHDSIILANAQKRPIDVGMQLLYPGASIASVFFPTKGPVYECIRLAYSSLVTLEGKMG